jgi:transposase
MTPQGSSPPAAYAGIAPVTRSSGSSIRGEHPARTGNRKLKRAFFLAVSAALFDPTSRALHQRKRDEGKTQQRRASAWPAAAESVAAA